MACGRASFYRLPRGTDDPVRWRRVRDDGFLLAVEVGRRVLTSARCRGRSPPRGLLGTTRSCRRRDPCPCLCCETRMCAADAEAVPTIVPTSQVGRRCVGARAGAAKTMSVVFPPMPARAGKLRTADAASKFVRPDPPEVGPTRTRLPTSSPGKSSRECARHRAS